MARAFTIASDVLDRLSVFSALSERLRRLQKAADAHNQVYGELSQYTDRELNDIGISRYMIRDIAREAARAA